jgi:DNA repair protein RadA/Sms
MAKPTTQFVCQECGTPHRKWTGKCDGCEEWNTLVEEAVPVSAPATMAPNAFQSVALAHGQPLEFVSLAESSIPPVRIPSTIQELDRVLGGGLVPGSAILIGGDPGIGKSTLLLQMVTHLAASGIHCAYISGEESVAQISLRAKRIGVYSEHLHLLAATSVGSILATLEQKPVQLVVIDSIQTMMVEGFAAAPGTVSQVRASAHALIQAAKSSGTIVVLVGHVTKDGQIAGPKVLEHMVDTVLYFEGEHGYEYRMLRSVKNRFGAVNEMGIFEMREEGLVEIANPSSMFLSHHEEPVSGTAIFAAMEGTRPLLVEVQALVSPTPMATPRRAVVGWDANRLAMMLAILSTRYGLKLADKEVYLNVVGGLKITEPAADLAVAAALISAVSNTPIPAQRLWIGEVGLSGEIRPVNHMETRLREAAKLGFTHASIPKASKCKVPGLELDLLGHIRQLAL